MWSGCAEAGDDVLDFVCGQGAVDLVGDDGVGVHDVLGDGFDLFHVAGKAAGMSCAIKNCQSSKLVASVPSGKRPALRIIVMGEILNACANEINVSMLGVLTLVSILLIIALCNPE